MLSELERSRKATEIENQSVFTLANPDVVMFQEKVCILKREFMLRN